MQPHAVKVLRFSLLIACLAAAGCAEKVEIDPATSKESGRTRTQLAFNRFPDMPLPVGGDIDLDRTLVFGGNESWFGRLVIKVSHGANDMFDFYKQKLGGYGWEEITSIRAATSVLTYARGDRVATIQIQARAIAGSEVAITVSPKGSPQMPAATPAPAPAPAAPAAARRVP